MGLILVLWACMGFCVALVVWACGGVSIIEGMAKGKANPLEKSNKKLTRGLKKSILNLGGSGKFL